MIYLYVTHGQHNKWVQVSVNPAVVWWVRDWRLFFLAVVVFFLPREAKEASVVQMAGQGIGRGCQKEEGATPISGAAGDVSVCVCVCMSWI